MLLSCFLFTVLATTAGWAFLLWLAARALAGHLKANPSAVYVLIELVAKKAEVVEPEEPEEPQTLEGRVNHENP